MTSHTCNHDGAPVPCRCTTGADHDHAPTTPADHDMSWD